MKLEFLFVNRTGGTSLGPAALFNCRRFAAFWTSITVEGHSKLPKLNYWTWVMWHPVLDGSQLRCVTGGTQPIYLNEVFGWRSMNHPPLRCSQTLELFQNQFIESAGKVSLYFLKLQLIAFPLLSQATEFYDPGEDCVLFHGQVCGVLACIFFQLRRCSIYWSGLECLWISMDLIP